MGCTAGPGMEPGLPLLAGLEVRVELFPQGGEKGRAWRRDWGFGKSERSRRLDAQIKAGQWPGSSRDWSRVQVKAAAQERPLAQVRAGAVRGAQRWKLGGGYIWGCDSRDWVGVIGRELSINPSCFMPVFLFRLDHECNSSVHFSPRKDSC